jgi:hypothetical protein
MSRKSPNLELTLPRCRHCNRMWRPAPGVLATHSYCNRCSADRRAKAGAHFGLKPFTPADVVGAYRLPRRLRGS